MRVTSAAPPCQHFWEGPVAASYGAPAEADPGAERVCKVRLHGALPGARAREDGLVCFPDGGALRVEVSNLGDRNGQFQIWIDNAKAGEWLLGAGESGTIERYAARAERFTVYAAAGARADARCHADGRPKAGAECGLVVVKFEAERPPVVATRAAHEFWLDEDDEPPRYLGHDPSSPPDESPPLYRGMGAPRTRGPSAGGHGMRVPESRTRSLGPARRAVVGGGARSSQAFGAGARIPEHRVDPATRREAVFRLGVPRETEVCGADRCAPAPAL